MHDFGKGSGFEFAAADGNGHREIVPEPERTHRIHSRFPESDRRWQSIGGKERDRRRAGHGNQGLPDNRDFIPCINPGFGGSEHKADNM